MNITPVIVKAPVEAKIVEANRHRLGSYIVRRCCCVVLDVRRRT